MRDFNRMERGSRIQVPSIQEALLTDLDLRVREVRQGPDGALYVFGGNSLIRISPAR